MSEQDNKARRIRILVIDVLKEMEGRYRRITPAMILGPSGLGYSFSLRERYFQKISIALQKRGWKLENWVPYVLAERKDVSVQDIIRLVMESASPAAEVQVRRGASKSRTRGSLSALAPPTKIRQAAQRLQGQSDSKTNKGIAAEATGVRAFTRDGVSSFTVQKTKPEDTKLLKVVNAKPKRAGKNFYFRLEGDAARGNLIIVNSTAQLVFNYAVPPDDALAIAQSKALAQAKSANLDISLMLTATGSISVVGTQLGTAKFKDQNLVAPVSFDLRSADTVGQATLHVQLSVKGELVHETEIVLAVVAALPVRRSTLRVNGPVDSDFATLAMRRHVPPPQKIGLTLSFSNEYLRLTVSELRDGDGVFQEEYQATKLTRLELENLLRRIQVALGSCYQNEEFWVIFDGKTDSDDGVKESGFALMQTLEAVAVAGSILDEGLRSDPQIEKAMDYIEGNLGNDAVLSISTDTVFLPWELLYPVHRSANMTRDDRLSDPVQTNQFWGARFAIETVKRGFGNVARLLDLHTEAKPRVTVNLNPNIEIPGVLDALQPLAVQRAWAKKLDEQGQLAGVQESCKDVRAVLQKAETDATFIYVYCHGTSPDFFGGSNELLELDNQCNLEPRDLKAGSQFRFAPIVFLSSCRGAVSSPLVFSSFLGEFRTRGALGMIGTSYSVPIAFAAWFAEEVVGRYLNRKGSLAVEMLELRRQHLIAKGNPVPLFYTLQCSLNSLPTVK